MFASAAQPSAPEPAPAAKRIALVAPSLACVLRDRANLIRALKARGHDVLVLAPSQLAGEIAALHGLGGEHRNFDPRPPGMALLANRRLMLGLRDLLIPFGCDVALVTGPSLASIAAMAARKAGARRIVTSIAGLGTGDETERVRQAQPYRRAVKMSDAVVCHNTTDARTVAAAFAVPAGKAPAVTPGDGVDPSAFWSAGWPAPQADGRIVFLMIADPQERSAIEAYAAAAREFEARGLPAVFQLATDREAAQDTNLLTQPHLQFLGRATDPAACLAAAHVAVHLSADDGSPTALKQALAAGRPVLTLDVPGCRDAVDQRVNGCLVPPGDGAALVEALASFIVHRHLIPAEGRASRAKAERAFDAGRTVGPYLTALGA